MEKSLIISYFAGMISRFKELYKYSFLKFLIDKIFGVADRYKKQSIIISTLSSESKFGERWRDSRFFNVVMIPLRFIKSFVLFILNSFIAQINGSRIISAINELIANLFNYSIRSYGAFLLGLLSVESILWVAFQVNELKFLILRVVLISISVFMLMLDVSVAAFLKSSFIYRFVEQGFLDSFMPYDDSKGAKALKLHYVVIAGAALGVLSYILPIKLAIAAAVAAIGFVTILKSYEVGLFLGAGFAALIPTTALYGIMGLTIFSFMLRWACNKLPKYKATAIDALVVLFFIVLCYSTISSFFIWDSINVLFIHTLMLVFYFVITRTINSRYKLYLLIGLLVISASFTSLYGVYQYYGGAASSEAWVDTTMFEDIQSRVGSTFNNPNILGEYLIMMIPLCLSLLWYKKKFRYKTIFAGMLVLMGLCMMLTFSRGAWLGLIVTMVGFSIVRDKRLFALFLVALFIMPFVLPPSVTNRFTSIGSLEDTSSSYRMSILLGSLRMAQDYWLTGVGLGSEAFKAIYPRYSLAAAYAHHSHNIYIQIILEMGVAGALVFMLLIIAFVRAVLAHQGKTKDRFLSSVMIAACTGIAGYLVQGLVENIWYNYRVLQTFWVVLAVGLCALNIAKGEVLSDD